MDYSAFQNLPSSSKLILATMQASRRLMGWEVHSGSVYKLTSFTQKIINKVVQDTTELTVHTNTSLSAGQYYLDRAANILYLRTSDSANPNGKFISVFVTFFFSNEPIVLPYDLDAGLDIYWEPLIKSTSEFGNNMDTINQTSATIDGNGTLNLINDSELWNSVFDLWVFDNKEISIFSHNREVPLSQIQILFRGRVTGKTWGPAQIQFTAKDQFQELRQPIPLQTLEQWRDSQEDITEVYIGANQLQQKVRRIYGRVFGHVCQNIHRELDGFLITGTADVTLVDEVPTLTFSGTTFIQYVSPGDKLVIDGQELTIATVVSNTALTFEEDELPFTAEAEDLPIYVQAASPKTYMNRKFMVGEYPLRQPTTTIATDTSTIDTLFVESNRDFYVGDKIQVFVDAGYTEVTVHSLFSTTGIKLKTSLATPPVFGAYVIRPALQNVRANNIDLKFDRDYTVSFGVIEFDAEAEKNAGPLKNLGINATFTNASKTVTGEGLSNLKPEWWVGCVGHVEMFQIASIESDASMTLKTNSSFTDTDYLLYKDFIIDDSTVVTCDALGLTDDTLELFYKTAPDIVRQILLSSPLNSDFIQDASFDEAIDVAYQEIGVVIPENVGDTKSPTFIAMVDTINKSVFGSLIIKHLGADSEVCYNVLSPNKDVLTTTKFTASDIFGFAFNSTNKNAVKTVKVNYAKKEYDSIVGSSSFSTTEKVSDFSNYVIETANEKIIESKLSNLKDAKNLAGKWSFLLSDSMGSVKFTTKLQAANLNVGDIIELEHDKMFERIGGNGKRRLFMIESIKKNGFDVKIEAVDFSNAFNRIACISESSSTYDTATENELIYYGYITDDYGMQDNDPDSFGQNLIW